MSTSLSLFTIEEALTELMQAREDLLLKLAEPENTEEEAESKAELAEVDKALAEYIQREAAKTDSIHGWLKQATVTASAARQEAHEMQARAQRLEDGIERLKRICCDVMASRGLKRLEGTAGRSLLRKGNGGLAPLQIDGWDAEKEQWTIYEPVLPMAFRQITVQMSADSWETLHHMHPALTYRFLKDEPNNREVRAALGEPCRKCAGTGDIRDPNNRYPDNPDAVSVCPECNGSGKCSIPGARLLERGDHLECK